MCAGVCVSMWASVSDIMNVSESEQTVHVCVCVCRALASHVCTTCCLLTDNH